MVHLTYLKGFSSMASPTVTTLVYPDDLRSEKDNPYGSNYVMFVLSDSSFRNPLTKLDSKKAKVISNAVNTLSNSTARNILGTVFSSLDALSKEWSAGGGERSQSAAQQAAVAARAVSGKESPSIPTPLKSGFCNIVLYTPPALSSTYSANYDPMSLTDRLFVLPTLTATPTNGMNAKDAKRTEMINKMKEGVNSAVKNTPDLINLANRTVMNPQQELLFKGVDFRTFSFSYTFSPKNKKESDTVQDIIRQFKGNMMPELTLETLMYKYPAEFDIYYYFDQDLNNNVHQHTTCVLEKVSINYAPIGQFSTFADGSPNHITMTLEFKELATLDKDAVLNRGY
jgi:hypothetical protein